MPPSATNHGLSVFTHADGAAAAATMANRRLRWPFADETTFPISNCFNDATSGEFYDHAAGHEGLDFACGDEHAVHAMYGGVVVEVLKMRRHAPYGKFVTIQSCTDLERPIQVSCTSMPICHRLQINSREWCWKLATTVVKGEKIGLSGFTGTEYAHLHVHLQPFDWTGVVPDPREDSPARPPDPPAAEEITTVATRISGCMNFACFLPASHGAPPVTFDFLRSFNQLLSARDSSAQIPVYEAILSNGTLLPEAQLEALTNRLGTIDGSKLGCYVVTGMYPLGDSPNWYQIRFNENENGWVPKTGNVIEVKPETPEQPAETITHQNVLWLRVEEAPATAAVTAPSQPYVLSLEVGVRVRSEPNADLSNVPEVLGTLTVPEMLSHCGD